MMKTHTTYYTIFFLFISFCLVGYNHVYADEPIKIAQPEIMPVSPEAAAVQKYVSYPVSYSTGLADITIPLYTIKSGDLELPITLSYHSAGIKLRQMSGWVGMNWTLNAEPSITREIRGIPDDESYGGYMTRKYFKEKEVTTNPDAKTRFFRRVENKEIDSEPDRFYYKLADQSGAFALAVKYPSGSNIPELSGVCVYPYAPIRVIGTEFLGRNALTIEDDKGIVYDFGSEYDGYTEMTGSYNTRWLCKEMSSSQTKAKISFQYSPFQIKSYNVSNFVNDYVVLQTNIGQGYGSRSLTLDSLWYPIEENTFLRSEGAPDMQTRAFTPPQGSYKLSIKKGAYTYRGEIRNGEVSLNEVISSDYQISDPYERYKNERVKERKPTRIDFDGGCILFDGDNYGLNSITVKSKDGRVIRHIDFYITPYNTQTPVTKLDSLVITTGDNPERRVYSFSYDKTPNVQSLASTAMDHWGYYNGQHSIGNGTRLSIPYGHYYFDDGLSYYFNFGDSARDCNEYWMQTGVLTDIYSPEGVQTHFTYNANRYGKQIRNYDYESYLNAEFLAGGLRIQSIREQSLDKKYSRTRYFNYGRHKPGNKHEYSPHLNNAGVPKRGLTQFDYLVKQECMNITTGWQGTKTLSTIRTWGSTPVSNITFSGGNSVYYPFVSEWITDTNGIESRTDYYFSTREWDKTGGMPDTPFSLDPSYSEVRFDIEKPFEHDSGYDALNYGQLIQKEIFADTVLVKCHKYEYLIFDEPLVDGGNPSIVCPRPYKIRTSNLKEYENRPMDLYKEYEPAILRGASRLKRERIIRYSDTGEESVQIREHIYCPDGEVEKFESHNDSDGDPDTYISSEWLYATKHLNPIRTRTRSGDNEIIEYFIYPEEARDSVNENWGDYGFIPPSRNGVGKLIAYKRVSGDDVTILKNVYSNFKLRSVQSWNPVLSKFEDRIKYTYNDYGNINSVTTDDRIYTSYIWSYYNQYPVAKIENASIDKVLTTIQKDNTWLTNMEKQSVPSDLTNIYNAFNTSNSHCTLFHYKPLIGVTSIKGSDGITTYFEYDGWGRLRRSYIIENNVQKTISTFDYNFPSYKVNITNME